MSGSATRKRRPGRPRKADAGDTKEALERAALALFARNGYAGTSIRAIAGEVGLSESVLYAHFESKQAIFDAVLARLGPRRPVDVAGRIDPDLADTDPPRYLRELVHAFLDDWDGHDARLLISLMTRDGLLHTPALQDALAHTRAAVAHLFDRWIAAGHVPADIGSPPDLALSFTGPIGLIRVLHLHADAGEQERAAARAEVHRHVETFTRAVFRRPSGMPSTET
ncbi:TetR/AcrR family transcriptional regulator [Qaidamihabitans albus]|uniref:TetR/AcrR family transcriptional regulator n=1 Tax=Qaidamihabitans albus TaxID=2795733 RepID=UPI001F3F2609|nr:TetR/AcrR family transcriptional regulator [Qaidamihabitans albus]